MQNQSYKEIEIKFEVLDLASFERKIQDLGGKTKGEFFQRTTRFDTPSDDLEKAGLFLRVRTGDKNTFTVKRKAKEDKTYRERDEWEVEVSDTKTVTEMLKALGYTKLLIMEKYRQTYTFTSLPKLEVTIDRLPFGNFAEIEGSKEDIEKAIADLGLQSEKRITATYWQLHEEYNKKHGLSEKNIIFATKGNE